MLATYASINFQTDFYQNNFAKYSDRLKAVNTTVNSRIANLNTLITEYNNASPDAKKIEILFELAAYHQFILNACPDYYVDFCYKFRMAIEHELYDAIQSEFKDLNASLYKPVLARFDLEKLCDDKALETLDIFLSNTDDVLYRTYFGKKNTQELDDITSYFASFSWEKDNKRIHSKLMHLRELLRIYIAETVPTSEEKKAIRSLIGAVNFKIKNLEVNNPEFVVEKQPGKRNFQEFIASMSSEKLAHLVKILDGNDFNAMRLGLNTLYPSSDISIEAQYFRSLMQEYTIDFLGGGNSKCFKITEMNPTGQPLVLKIDNRMSNPRLTEVKLGRGALLDILPVKYLDRKITYTANGEDKTRGVVVMDYYPQGDLRNYLSTILHWDERRDKAIQIYKQMAEILIAIENAEAAFPDAKNHNWLVDNTGHLVIADTKSFIPVLKGKVNRSYLNNGYYSYTNTYHMNSKKVKAYLKEARDFLPVDELHAYMLGKNLFQFLTGYKSNGLNDLESWFKLSHIDFEQELFRDEIGKALKQLILGLVSSKPMPIRAAFGDLENLEIQKLKCDNLRLIAVLYQDPYKTDKEKLINAEIIAQDLMQSLGTLKALMIQDCANYLNLLNNLPFKNYQMERITKNERNAIELIEIRNNIIEKILHSQNEPIKKRIELLSYKFNEQVYLDLLEEAVRKVIDHKDLSGYKAIQDRLTIAEQNQDQKLNLVNNIVELLSKSFGIDALMDDYVVSLFNKVELATEDEIRAMTKDVVAVYQYPLVTDVLALIERYKRKSLSMFAIGMNNKAVAIEQAFAKIPVHLRNCVFAKTLPETVSAEVKENMLEVRIAIASSRHLKSASMKEGDVDENKANHEYKILKEKYSRIESHDQSFKPF